MLEKWVIALAAGGGAVIGAAAAHPGPKLLTAGNDAARAAMTRGMTFEEVDGVHVFRGTDKAAPEEVPARIDMRQDIDIKVTHRFVWRLYRPLRTQGFYSGNGPKSRRYRQGFYSGR